MRQQKYPFVLVSGVAESASEKLGLTTHDSVRPFPSSTREAVALAEFISSASHPAMLTTAFGAVPPGLRGALGRSGPQPYPRPFYRLLFKVLTESKHEAAAKVVQQLDCINPKRLLIAQRLPPDIRTASLVKVIADPRMAGDVATLVELFTRHGIDRPALAEALSQVATAKQLSELWDRWSQKLVFPQHPVPASEHHVPITNGSELRLIALHYRNCVPHYLTKIMEGEAAFCEFHWGGDIAVIHLKRRDSVWTLEGLFGKGNEVVPQALQSAAEDHLRKFGVVATVGASSVESAGPS